MTRSLLDEPVLLMQQISSMTSNNFDIADGNGQPVGYVETIGSLANRLIAGSRTLNVHESDGTLVLGVHDPMNFVRDIYELADPNGQPLAHLRTRFTFLRTRVDMHLADGTLVELHGNALDFNFDFRLGNEVPARVTRQWSGLGNAFLGRSTYAVELDQRAPRNVRAAVVGGVIALDLLRRKKEND